MIQETFPIIVGGAEVLNERILLTQVENGLLMKERTLSASSSSTAPLPDVIVTIRWSNCSVTTRSVASEPSATTFTFAKTVLWHNIANYWRWAHMPVASIDAVSVSVMREGWTNMAIQQIPVHRYRKRLY